MDFQVIATTMCSLFIIVMAGFFSHKRGIINEEFERKLSGFVIKVTCPALLISSTMGDKMPDKEHIPMLLLVSLLTYVILIPLAYVQPVIMRVKRDLRGMYSFMLTYSNVGFIGYPVVASIFGSDAVFYACILNVFNTITVFIWGVMFISGENLKEGFRFKLFVSPAMIATYISVVIVLLNLHIPKAIAMPLTILGNMTVPSSLIVIGAALAEIPTRKMIGTPHIFIMCFLKLLVLPLLVYYAMLSIGVDVRISSINMILIAMPVASFGTMFCMQMGKDETTMSQGTFWTTLLSVASIPLLAMLIA
ncbi:MAG: AEC family transporter [Prevotellaceae bacterium]|nr:AEC family transporter [Prevotellaceae bacterium]